jgi:antitoxin PrlF
MASSTLTSKGQITLPKSVRDRLHLGAGDKVEFVETESGFELRTAKRDIREIKGLLAMPGKPVSVESMNQAIAQMGRLKP